MRDILDDSVGTTTAEVLPMISLHRGALFGFSVVTDRKMRPRGGLTKGRKVGTVVHQDLPGLLRSVADLCEQEGGTFGDLVRVLENKPRGEK